jgi:hypothetical protein
VTVLSYREPARSPLSHLIEDTVTSTAEALSGTWAANLPGWAATTALASIIVVIQEIATPLPDASWIAISVLLQIVVSSFWGTIVAGISRRRRGRVTLPAAVLLWVGLGVTRGVAGGIVASAAGLDPEWAYRIGFWTLVALCWMPLITYALAQLDERRRLLAVRSGLAETFDAATARAAESAGERSRRMSRAVDDALGPALDEIRSALRESPTLDEPEVAAIAARLDGLAARTAGFTASAPVVGSPRSTGRVSVGAALTEFEMRRPVFAALLAAVDTAPLILPGAYRDGGWPDVAESVVAIAASTAALIGLYSVLRPFLFAGRLRSTLTRVGVLGAGLTGTTLMILLPWDPFGPQDHILIAAFPIVFWFAAAATGTAVALEATNTELGTRVEDDRVAVGDLAALVAASEQETAARLETLVRGDLNGRVASCALALGLLADGAVPADSRQRVIRGVLEQLDDAAAELRTA